MSKPIGTGIAAMVFTRWTIGCACMAIGALLASQPEAIAQERYDDHELDDRLYLQLGGYHTTNIDTTLQVDSKSLGLGTIINAEDLLRVDRSITVFRLDGYRRFSRAHRIEWAYFDQTRNGLITLEDDIDIGDVTFPAGFELDTELKFRLAKASYSWSFINTARYEFFMGAGLNIRTTALRMYGEGTVGDVTEVRTFDESATLPLPTVAVGLRYSLGDRLTFHFRNETFFIEINDASGRLQDNYFLIDYRIGKRLGIGGGVNFFSFDLKDDLNSDTVVKSDTSHVGIQLFLSARL